MVVRAALIPARGGSQRIPRKNIRDFAGQPALTRLIRTLQGSGVFDEVYVSTEDDEIAEVATAAGAAVPFRRPLDLADNMTGARPVIQHAVTELKIGGSVTVGVFYPTAVLLDAHDVRASLEMFEGAESDFVLSVGEYPAPIARALTMDEAGIVAPLNSKYQATRTQDLSAAFHDLGQFYWGSADNWLSDVAVVNAKTLGYLIDPWRAIDIDTPDDWRRAEIMYRVLHESE